MCAKMIKDRLLLQIRTNELIREKIETTKTDKRYYKDQLIKSEGICEGLRIALEIVYKLESNELKKVA
jgi:hypothetical protein